MQKEKSTNVLLANHVDVENRTIYLPADFDIMSPTEFKLRAEMIIQNTGDNQSPIQLELAYCSSDFSALAMVDTIQAMPMKINIHVTGFVRSGAILALAAATGTRSMSPNSFIQFSNLNPPMEEDDVAEDDLEDESSADEEPFYDAHPYLYLAKRADAIFSSCVDSSKINWMDASAHYRCLSPQEALELKIIDEIV